MNPSASDYILRSTNKEAMHSVTLITLLAFVGQAYAEEVAANDIDDSQRFMNEVIDKLVDKLADTSDEDGDEDKDSEETDETEELTADDSMDKLTDTLMDKLSDKLFDFGLND